MKKILIVQRYERIGAHNELRDNLDNRLSNYVFKLGYLPILIPTNIKITSFLKQVKPDGILLSGGGDPRKKDLRKSLEIQLLKFSLKKNLPVLGICRGAQQMNLFCKGKIKKIENHIGKKHRIFGRIVNKKIYVNSYHNYGINKKFLGRDLKILAYSKDEWVECFVNKKNNWMGIMWHPERENNISKLDKKIINNCFKKNLN
jgi:N5-(cytidine 5'-diphosphoramidyl)-L-glutamine hydrolase